MPSTGSSGQDRERNRRVLLAAVALVIAGGAAAALTSVPPPDPESYEKPVARALPPPVERPVVSPVGREVSAPGVAAAALLSPQTTFGFSVTSTEVEPTESGDPAPTAPSAPTSAVEEQEEPTPTPPPPTTTTSTTVAKITAGGAERSLVKRVNSVREAEELPPLAWDGGAAAVARDWSEHMVDTDTFAHNPNLASSVEGSWTKLAENLVRDADTAAEAHAALAGSGTHYANMVDPDFTHIGVGVAIDSDGEIWATEIFIAR